MTTGVHILVENNYDQPLLVALQYISNANPAHNFIVFTEKSIKNLSENCTQIIISPKPKNRLLLYYWYNYKLPKLLLKYGVGTFITNAAMLAPASNTKQFLFFADIDFENDKNVFFKKKTVAALTAAEYIFVTNEYIATLLAEKYHLNASKIIALYFDLPAKKSTLLWNEIEANKDLYTDGFDYFLFPVSADSVKKIVVVLKAFSQFKKWQKSSIKLVLLLNNVSEENLVADFKNYKYKDEVKIILQRDDNNDAIIASTFSIVFFGSYIDFPIVYTALQNDIPVMAADNKVNNVLFKNTVLYTNVVANDLAAKMQLIYKDENQKKLLMQHAGFLLQKYSSENASSEMFQLMTS